MTTVIYKTNRFLKKTKNENMLFIGEARPLLRQGFANSFLSALNNNEKNARDEKNLLTLDLISIIIYLYE